MSMALSSQYGQWRYRKLSIYKIRVVAMYITNNGKVLEEPKGKRAV